MKTNSNNKQNGPLKPLNIGFYQIKYDEFSELFQVICNGCEVATFVTMKGALNYCRSVPYKRVHIFERILGTLVYWN